jgi:hypothetical protein
MRVCRGDEQTQRNRQQQLNSYPTSNQQYTPVNDIYTQQQQYFYPQYQQPPQQQQQYITSPR